MSCPIKVYSNTIELIMNDSYCIILYINIKRNIKKNKDMRRPYGLNILRNMQKKKDWYTQLDKIIKT